MLTRRTATVIISAPEASWARTMTDGDEYLPVPTIRREENVRSAMIRLSVGIVPCLIFSSQLSALSSQPLGLCPSAASYEVDDLHFVACADRRDVERRAFDDDEIMLDGDTPRIDVELIQQLRDGQRSRGFERFAIQGDGH